MVMCHEEFQEREETVIQEIQLLSIHNKTTFSVFEMIVDQLDDHLKQQYKSNDV